MIQFRFILAAVEEVAFVEGDFFDELFSVSVSDLLGSQEAIG
jgi:hypothetical protein